MSVAFAAAVAACLAWFTWPALEGTVNEGFQATVIMNAHAMLHGGLASVDPLHGLNNDFMLHSRLGVSAVLAGLMALGMPPVLAFRLVMLASLAGLVASSAGLVAWRCRVHPVPACVPLLLFPGVFESAWFPNDNVLSAALSSTALLVLWRGASKAAPSPASLANTAGAAALWGMAVACRTDAVLLAPAFAAVALSVLPGWGDRVRHALVAGPAAVAVPVLAYAAFGLNILDILPLTQQATAVWARTDGWAQVAATFLKGFALPGLLAAAAGALAVLRRPGLNAVLCLGVPLLYVLAYGRMLTEVRYLLPLTPFFGILMVEGARAVLRAGRRVRWAGCAAFGVALAVCFLPPDLPGLRPVGIMAADHDMPRPFPGRFWSPAVGAWWNRTLDAGAAALEGELGARIAAADVPGAPPVLVVSTYWTPDRTVSAILRERGFVLAQPGLPAACQQAAERFTRGNATVIHLRPHLPMAPGERAGVNWEALSVPCLHALGAGAEAPVLVAGWAQVRQPPIGLPAVTFLHVASPGVSRAARELMGWRYSYFVAAATVHTAPLLLQAAINDAETKSARLALSDGRIWTHSRISER